MTEQRLQEIEQRLTAATTGQWEACDNGVIAVGCGQPGAIVVAEVTHQDVPLVEHAPADLRDLVAAIRAQAATIATLTRERDEARQRANEQEAEKEMESHAADVWEMDCKKAEADRDAWKAKAEAAEQRLAEFNAYLADAPTVGRQCPLCRAEDTTSALTEARRVLKHVLSELKQTDDWGVVSELQAEIAAVLAQEEK